MKGKFVVVGGLWVVEFIVVGGVNFVVGIIGIENYNLFLVYLLI